MDHPDESAVPIPAYRVAVDGMSCQHCVNAVEKAVLAVAGVTSASVSLEAGYVEVEGGLPHEVVEAIKVAGYDGRPQAKVPASCSLEPPGDEDQSAPPAKPADMDHGYQIHVSDMTCAACVARVERAARSVPGVSSASVNLIENLARDV